MNNSTTALFLLTGLVTACGTNAQQDNYTNTETEAMLAALNISLHYPQDPFGQAADGYIDLMQEDYLEHA